MSESDWGTIKAACRVIGGSECPVHPSTYYRGVKAGIYPAPVRVSPGVSRVPMRKLRDSLEQLMEHI